MARGDSRGEFPPHEHYAAVDRCLAAGLLTVLSADDVTRETFRRENSGLPELVDLGVREGALDFTPNGYRIHRTILQEIFGPAFIDRDHSGWNHLEERNRFEILAATSMDCLEHLNRISSQVEHYCGVPAIVTNVTPLIPIDSWRPNRFVMRSSGFRANLEYHQTETETNVPDAGE